VGYALQPEALIASLILFGQRESDQQKPPGMFDVLMHALSQNRSDPLNFISALSGQKLTA
jgi:hypothetical protein